MMVGLRTWTDDMLDTLRAMWSAGKSGGEIGQKLGISASAVIGKARRLGLEARRTPIVTRDDRFEQVIDLITDFDVSMALAAQTARIDPATAQQMWDALCARKGRQYQ